MSMQEFLKPRFVGKRFKDGGMPLEFLKDLTVLEEMIIEIAKVEFLKDNPDRKRSPRGFTDAVSLKLTAIESGSTVPIISLEAERAELFPTSTQNYFESARTAVINAIDAASSGEDPTRHIPEKTLSYFDRFGRGLHKNEAIEFPALEQMKTVRFDQKVRRNLVYASTSTREMTEEVTIRGLVPEMDQDNMQFELQMADGKKLKAPISPQHRDIILATFNGYLEQQKIQIQGVAKVDRNNRLATIESISHIDELEQLDISFRLDELRMLKDGWMGPGSKAISAEGASWLEGCFKTHYPDELSPPYLYPVPEGDIRAEWHNDTWNISLDIELKSRQAYFHAMSLISEKEEEQSFNLSNESDWKQCIKLVKEKIEVS
jgi:hypothetical protein